jgi:hypothetical protein
MNAALNRYRDHLFIRSCLESAPACVAPARFIGSGCSRGPSRAPLPLHRLKQDLLQAALKQADDSMLYRELCRIANEAAEQAWDTAFPLLVFPCLFAEMVQELLSHFEPAPQAAPVMERPASPTPTAAPFDPGLDEVYPDFHRPGPISRAETRHGVFLLPDASLRHPAI